MQKVGNMAKEIVDTVKSQFKERKGRRKEVPAEETPAETQDENQLFAKLGIDEPYVPQYEFPIPPGIIVGDASTCTAADVNVIKDLSKEQQAALQQIATHMGVLFNSVPRIVREPELDYMRIPVPPYVEARVKQTPPYPLSRRAKGIIDEVFDKNRKYGRITDVPSTGSPYSLPVFVAAKDRPVIDMRPLSAIVPGDAYPLPRQEDVTSKLRGKQFISSIDITSAFYQRMIHPDDRYRMAVVTHRGHEMFNVTTMGFKRSPAHQQKFVDRLIRDHKMAPFMAYYINDIIIYSDTFEEHLHHLLKVFRKLADVGVTLKATKCHLGFHSLEILGYIVDRFGLCTMEQKARAIMDIPPPSTLADLEKFIGLTKWSRQLVPYYAQRIRPLQNRKKALNKQILQDYPINNGKDSGPTRAKRVQAAKRMRFDLTPTELAAFRDIQPALATKTTIHHFDPTKTLYVFLDASRDYGFGACAYQQGELDRDPTLGGPPISTLKVLVPIAYLSREATSAEKNYWPTELEMAGLVWCIKKLKGYIESEATKVEFYTDHLANAAIAKMESLKITSPAKENLRLQNWAVFLSQYWPQLIVS